MMDRTDRHYRYMMRKITKKTLLYTEMITAKQFYMENEICFWATILQNIPFHCKLVRAIQKRWQNVQKWRGLWL